MANGVFDILHIGHKWHLEEAAKLGGKLIVALTVDEHVNKGPHRPINPWAHRAELLDALSFVDDVVPSISGADAILKWKPDIFVKGIDYTNKIDAATIAACKSVGAEIRILDTPKLSSTAIYDRLRQS